MRVERPPELWEVEGELPRSLPGLVASRPTGPSAPRALARGLTRRCPACGQGKLFLRWFTLTARCPSCGLVFERREGAFLRSLATTYGVTGVSTISMVGVMIANTLPSPPLHTIIAGAILMTLFLPLLILPFARPTLVAVDLLRGGRAAAERAFGVETSWRTRSSRARRR